MTGRGAGAAHCKDEEGPRPRRSGHQAAGDLIAEQVTPVGETEDPVIVHGEPFADQTLQDGTETGASARYVERFATFA